MKKAKNKEEADAINKMYRTENCQRYSKTPDVIGIQIHLSNNHQQVNLCNDLIGIYPKTFVFDRHVDGCKCFVTPVLAPEEEFDNYIEAVLNGNGDDFVFGGLVEDVPNNFKLWVRENGYFLQNWDLAPSIIRSNYAKGNIIALIEKGTQ